MDFNSFSLLGAARASAPDAGAPNQTLAITGKWLPPLDGLRGLAIVMVMLFHYAMILNRHQPLQRAVASLSDFGWTGVDLFFVLSGFLITGILLDTSSATNYFNSFYTRRILRIFPLYYLSLPLIFFVIAPADAHPHTRIWYLFYAQNWVMTKVFFAGHYWSLAVEEQFYLLWPFVVRQFNRRQVLQIAIAGALAAVVLRLALLAENVDPYYIYRNVFTRMDALLIGAACACLIREEKAVRTLCSRTKWLWWMPVVMFAILRLSSKGVGIHMPGTQRFGYTIIALAYAALLLGVVVTMGTESLPQRVFTSGFMRVFGKYSYGAYVWHRMVALAIQSSSRRLHLSLPWFMELPAMFAATLAVSIGSYKVIERPFLALKSHFEPRYASALSRAE